MGAYSSFGMLALTHHVLVQVSAIKAGISGRFIDYCILGDDVVIANDSVAKEYSLLMENLGVDISENKSIISSMFTEFAKRLRGVKGFDITPIGSGLLLYTLRNRYYICILVSVLFRRGLLNMRSVYPHYINILPKKFLRYKKLIE